VFSGVKIARWLVAVTLLVLLAGCSAGTGGTASENRPSAAMVVAGLLSVVLFPLGALTLLRAGKEPVATDPARRTR